MFVFSFAKILNVSILIGIIFAKKNNFEVTGFGLVNLLIYVLSELLDKEYSQNVIISGDFNVKFGTMDVDTIVLCNLLAYGLSYFNSKPNRGRSCLDNYFLQN